MDRFSPILASENIKKGFIDYITTSFNMSDPVYAQKLKEELHKENYIAKGPFLEVSGSYRTGMSIEELICSGEASHLFRELEPVPEKERELKLQRPLYIHQEQALRRANTGKNLIVTTGTGSGKTECFLIPIVNELLREQEKGQLDYGVRAIIIYPMNALANDQMKRMRALLKAYPDIKIGLYNGNTEHRQSDALRVYKDSYGVDAVPLENELISREVMQATPPHILITNYSMLEYMMLRPKDDKVFSSAKLRYIILDEAHIYRGTTGMETAMLMRRLRARIGEPDKVQYILTSATLGGAESNSAIVDFATNLCGAPFLTDNIIRAQSALPMMKGNEDFPNDLFTALAHRTKSVGDVLKAYQVTDYCPAGEDAEKLYELLLHSSLFAKLVEYTRSPVTVSELSSLLAPYCALSEEQFIDFISVCTEAEYQKSSLIKARYHFFVRALEGAYVTLNQPTRLFLRRKNEVITEDARQRVFEIAVCTDCGRIALVGKDVEGYLQQIARRSDNSSEQVEYYLLSSEALEQELFDEEEDEDEKKEKATNESQYVLCPRCGRLEPRASLRSGPICGCPNVKYANVIKVKLKRGKDGKIKRPKCPACGFGHFRAFYLGSEAATSVLGTELFEQLPDEVVNLAATIESNDSENLTGPFAIFKEKKTERTVVSEKSRQFLSFSDSRSDAAFFASYMEKTYEEFLRRRGIWQVIEGMSAEKQTVLSVPAFVNRLIQVFDANETFRRWTPDGKDDADAQHERSKENAWIAVLNEMFNARRGTSLPSMGVLSFEYSINTEEFVNSVSQYYKIEQSDARALLNLLVMDAVYFGAIEPGNSVTLSDPAREYVFFTPRQQALVCTKLDGESGISGWAGRKRENGSYYSNTRMRRLVEAFGCSEDEADSFLRGYWNNIFKPTGEKYILKASDFTVRVMGDPELHIYRCKKCGRITSNSVKGRCSTIKCNGMLEEIDPMDVLEGNHYANLYRSKRMTPLQIKEHTAQLARNRQTLYQQAFVNKQINALSCSTTFEMGVDVGSLETVYMRNVPPNPANYVQRAGRAGRALHSAAFVLTYAKLSSHDLTFYQDPGKIISGQIKVPIFALENEKVIYRHIYAVALSAFLAVHEEVYDGDNRSNFLNEQGYEKFKEYLDTKPGNLRELLRRSIPENLHSKLGIHDFSWTEQLVGEKGVLEIAFREYDQEIKDLQKEIERCKKHNLLQEAGDADRALKRLRCGKDDGQQKKSLIDFLVRNNVLPKYGFPVDTVELQVNSANKNARGLGMESLQLARDLQMAIAEYAPGSQVIADGKMYTSRYVRKLPGKNSEDAWEKGFYCKCPACEEPNFTKRPLTRKNGGECVSCHTHIAGVRWQKTIEPRRGFWSEPPVDVPLHKPDRDFKTDDYYVGDIQSNTIQKRCFVVNDLDVELESTRNDTLAVVGVSEYSVCPYCGYASETGIPAGHKTARGYKCDYTEGGTRYRFSHTFKTDVAKVTFYVPQAQDYATMISVMYALLEGISRNLDVERADIKGCLHRVSWAGSEHPIFSIILYDAVAGGAGHVRRVVSESGDSFRKVVKEAIGVLKRCDCEPSCYQCLRNYYNQKIHDILDRRKAAAFLEMWDGEYTPIEEDQEVREPLVVIDRDKCKWEHQNWQALNQEFDIGAFAEQWDKVGVPHNCLVFPTIQVGQEIIAPWFVWEDSRVMVFETAEEIEAAEAEYKDWSCFDINVDAQKLYQALKKEVS